MIFNTLQCRCTAIKTILRVYQCTFIVSNSNFSYMNEDIFYNITTTFYYIFYSSNLFMPGPHKEYVSSHVWEGGKFYLNNDSNNE